MTESPNPFSWPSSEEDATADRLARHYAARSWMAHRRVQDLIDAEFAPGGQKDFSEQVRAANSHIDAATIAYLLRCLDQVDRAAADVWARAIWSACEDGTVYVAAVHTWIQEYGVDPDALAAALNALPGQPSEEAPA